MKNLILLMLLAFACNCVYGQCGSASYIDPDFSITVQNPACPLVGEINVINVSGGVGPYTYTLMPNNVTNSTGTFSNLNPGTYLVQLKDACGTIRSRQATITPYNINISSSMVNLGCRNFRFTINSNANGTPLQYGYAINGSSTIVWGDSSVIHLTLDPQTSVALYVKDACGNQGLSYQTVTKEIMGYIKELQERIMCNGQEIYPVFYGFDAPKVCLYKSPQNTLVECKQAPSGNYTGGAATNFFNLPFGQDYYIIVQDGCYRDSAFFKDKTSAGGSELNPFNWKCNTFDIHSDGNNYDTVCLYNATTNQLVSCKKWTDTSINPNTGKPWPYGGAEWYDLPYGTYYSYIYDPCEDTLVRIDTTVSYPHSFKAEIAGDCQITVTGVRAYFNPSSMKPYTTEIYYPDGTLATTHTSNLTQVYLTYNTLPLPGTVKIIQKDFCGFSDTSFLLQEQILPKRVAKIYEGCPGVMGSSGGGDIEFWGNYMGYHTFGITKIINYNGTPVSISNTSQNIGWNDSGEYGVKYQFTNLQTGKYVIESTVGCNGYKYYDTVNIKPYTYPIQEQTHIFQCNVNPYNFKDTITGGVGPYTYEIINTSPLSSSLTAGPQSSNSFSIPPGTNLSSITIRVLDACGNSHTKIFPVNQSGDCNPLVVDTSKFNQTQTQNRSIKIFPNPSGKQFNISFSQKKKTDYKIEIYNVSGIKLFSREYKNIDFKDISIKENLNAGTYIINILDLSNNKQYYHKQVIF
ncbi:MAG: T9SS type A sorting domain-containing protein [Flavobacterium sp.]|nr:MAG: T9SS type A sorting domain-containing protein [Flavobacterium sp.]